MQKTAFVTGAAGQLGSALIEKLLSEGYQITAFILPHHDDTLLKSYEGKGVEKIIKADITNPVSLLNQIPQGAIVFHCYSLSPGANQTEEIYQQSNVQGTKNVLEAAKKANASKFIYTSSCSVIGPKATPTHSISETDVADPNEPYGRSKHDAETEINKWHQETKIPTAICRIFPLYGPRAHINSTPVRLMKLIQKKRFYMIGDGNNTYEFCFSRNAADGVALAAQKITNGIQTYNTSEPIRRSYNEVIFEIAKHVNPQVKIVRIPPTLAKIIGHGGEFAFKVFRKRTITRLRTVEGLLGGWTSNCTKEVTELGYTQKYTLEQGVEELVSWAKNKGLLDTIEK